MSEPINITIPVAQLAAWEKKLSEALNPTVQFDRDNDVMLKRAYEARTAAIEEVLKDIDSVCPF